MYNTFPKDGKVVYNFANLLADANENERAIEMYLLALEIEEKPNIYYNLGNTYCELKEHNLAIDAFDNAIKMKHDYYEAMFNKAISLTEVGQKDSAIIVYLKIVESNQMFHQA